MSTKILIVDDEPNLLRLIGYALEHEGYQVVVAQSGAEALSKVQAEQPDLMILDVMLPDMSGIEVCQQVRSRPEMISLPIIMLSARAQVPDKIAGLQAGADEYVTKPIDSDEMVTRVAALLKRTDRLRHMQPSKRGKVVGFMGAKGGVGTTTITLNVASILAQQKNVVAVELRSCYGTFGPQLGYNVGANLGDLFELEAEHIDERTLSKSLVKLSPGLRALFGPQKAAEFQDIEPAQGEAVINGLGRMADYVVVDLPCCPHGAVQAAARLCGVMVLVVEREPTCVMAGKIALDLLKSWGVHGVAGALIVNRAVVPVPMSLPEIRSGLGCELVGVVPPAAEACMAAQRQGLPLVLYQPDNMAAVSLTEIANRLAADKIAVLRL